MNKIFYLTPIVDQDNGDDMMKEERRPLGKPLIRTMIVPQRLCPWGNMVAFPETPGKERKATMQNKTREEILKGSGRAD